MLDRRSFLASSAALLASPLVGLPGGYVGDQFWGRDGQVLFAEDLRTGETISVAWYFWRHGEQTARVRFHLNDEPYRICDVPVIPFANGHGPDWILLLHG